MTAPNPATITVPEWLSDLADATMEKLGVTHASFSHTNGIQVRGERSDTRAVLCYVLRQYTHPGGIIASYPEIANAIGMKSHSSVIQACERVKESERLTNIANEILSGFASEPAKDGEPVVYRPPPRRWRKLQSDEVDTACAEAIAETLEGIPWRELPKEERENYRRAWRAANKIRMLAEDGE